MALPKGVRVRRVRKEIAPGSRFYQTHYEVVDRGTVVALVLPGGPPGTWGAWRACWLDGEGKTAEVFEHFEYARVRDWALERAVQANGTYDEQANA